MMKRGLVHGARRFSATRCSGSHSMRWMSVERRVRYQRTSSTRSIEARVAATPPLVAWSKRASRRRRDRAHPSDAGRILLGDHAQAGGQAGRRCSVSSTGCAPCFRFMPPTSADFDRADEGRPPRPVLLGRPALGYRRPGRGAISADRGFSGRAHARRRDLRRSVCSAANERLLAEILSVVSERPTGACSQSGAGRCAGPSATLPGSCGESLARPGGPVPPADPMRKTRAMEWLKIPYRAAWRLVMDDEGLELSGYIAFTAFLSLFPFLIFLAALAGFLGDRETGRRVHRRRCSTSCPTTSPKRWRRRYARWSARARAGC